MCIRDRSRSAHYSGRVGFVHHYQCIILFGKVTYLVHGSYIAVHGAVSYTHLDVYKRQLELLSGDEHFPPVEFLCMTCLAAERR